MHRALRYMICLLLICAFMINLFPIRSEASTLAAGAILVKAWPVIKAVAVGLGVVGITDLMVDRLVDNLTSGGIVDDDGYMQAYHFGDGFFGVSQYIIEGLRNLFFSSGYVIDPSYGMHGTILANTVFTLPHGIADSVKRYFFTEDVTYLKYKYLYGEQTATERSWRFGIILHCPNEFNIYEISSNGSESYVSKGKWSNTYSCYRYTNLGYALNYDIGSSELSRFESELASYVDITSTGLTNINDITNYLLVLQDETPYVSDGTESGYIASASLTLSDGYPEWTQNAIRDDNDGDVNWYVPIGSTAVDGSNASDYTQESVWAGSVPVVVPKDDTVVIPPAIDDGTITVPDNATLKDILTGVLTIPQAISIAASNVVAAVQAIPAAIQAIPAAIADFFSFKPPPDHNQFALVDLKDFFPFCIPFDLYAFFQLLDADPVAPVLSWEIPDLSGQVYSLSIDLAEWDSVALLFRRLQLFLFITGLAAASRKFIKW